MNPGHPALSLVSMLTELHSRNFVRNFPTELTFYIHGSYICDAAWTGHPHCI